METKINLGSNDLVLPGATLGHPPLLDHIRLAAGNGFAGVSIRTADYLRALAEGSTAEQIRAAIADAGLLVADIDCIAPILGSSEPGGEFYGATEDDVLRCAEALGARSVNLILQKNREGSASGTPAAGNPAPDNPVADNPVPDTHEAIVEAAAADAARVADRAADIGVLVHLEPIPFMPIKDAVTALEIVAEADRPNLGIQIDAWHHFRGPIPASANSAEASHTAGSQSSDSEAPNGLSSKWGRTEENGNTAKSADAASRPTSTTHDAMAESCGVFFSFPGQRIFAIQVCDAGPPQGRPFEDTMKRRLFPGEGEFPLATLIATLRLIGCQAPVSVEVFSDPLSPDQQASTATKAAESARTLLKESTATLQTMMEQFSH